MTEPLSISHSQLEYFGISPYLSSENALARFSWGLAERELEIFEIENFVAQAPSTVVIPSHFWWRSDAKEILSGCQPYSAKVKLQIGPGFELKCHLLLAIQALNLGYQLQILIQATLTTEQRSRLQELTQNFSKQIEFLFLFQESPTDPLEVLEELKSFGCENLSLGLTKRNWSQLYPEMKKAAFKPLPVYDFEKSQIRGLREIVEQTSIAQKTRIFRSTQFQFPVKELFRVFSHFFLLILAPGKKNLAILRQSSSAVMTNAYWSFVQKVYWDFLFQVYTGLFRKTFVRSYWTVYAVTSSGFGRARALKVRGFWFFYGLIRFLYQWCKEYPFWPLRKVYWFSKYQFEKRVLRKCKST